MNFQLNNFHKFLILAIIFFTLPSSARAAMYYVCDTGSACNAGGSGWTTGSNSNTCTLKSAPCKTIAGGIGKMSGGDTLIVGNGTYTETNPIRYVPSGNDGVDNIAGTADDVYTTARAENDFGVLIDGSAWPNTWVYGVNLYYLSYVTVRGFKIHANKNNDTGGPITVIGGDHIKIIRNGFAYAGVEGPDTNTANGDFGPDVDYLLVEENYAFGGGRYQFVNYWNNHAVFRRNVARNDYFNSALQSAAFTNYDSINTVWQNNIAADSDTACCTVHSGLYAGFFNENKTDHAPDTSQEFHGNIVLNYKTIYGAHLDWVVSGTRNMSDNIYWDSNGGYWGDQGPGTTASWPSLTNLTSGGMTGTYDGNNGAAALGTGISILSNLSNTVKNSIFANNNSYGVADYTNGNHNAFYGNGSNYGGVHTSIPGTNDITSHNIIYNASSNPNGSLKYLPRGPENVSTLATAGESGGRVGAQALWKIGVDGTLYGQTGWNTVRNAANGYGNTEDELWPFPNEAVIKSEMASYNGLGLSATRGFCTTGKQLNGISDATLTSYIWEYLGNQIPCEIYDTCGGDTTPPAAPSGLSVA